MDDLLEFAAEAVFHVTTGIADVLLGPDAGRKEDEKVSAPDPASTKDWFAPPKDNDRA